VEWIVFGVLVLVAVLLLVWIVTLYNGLVRRRNQVDNAWSQIDVQLKRRYDLIPNPVETAQGYAAHERSTLEAVTTARAAAIGAQGPAAQAEADNVPTRALKSLFAGPFGVRTREYFRAVGEEQGPVTVRF